MKPGNNPEKDTIAVHPSENPRYLIHVQKTEIREGYRLADTERVLASYAAGFSDLSEGWPSFGGAAAKSVLRARLEALFEGNEVRLVPLIIDVLVFNHTSGYAQAGASALAYGWHEMELTPKDGSPAHMRRTRFVELWREGADGQWRIALFLDNLDQPSAFAEETIAALRAGIEARVQPAP